MSLLRCHCCKGRKKVYKINNVYTMTDICGSPAIECPECGGLGKVLSEEEKARLRAEKAEVKLDKRSREYREVKKLQGA